VIACGPQDGLAQLECQLLLLLLLLLLLPAATHRSQRSPESAVTMADIDLPWHVSPLRIHLPAATSAVQHVEPAQQSRRCARGTLASHPSPPGCRHSTTAAGMHIGHIGHTVMRRVIKQGPCTLTQTAVTTATVVPPPTLPPALHL
jgi:hypothetical protein